MRRIIQSNCWIMIVLITAGFVLIPVKGYADTGRLKTEEISVNEVFELGPRTNTLFVFDLSDSSSGDITLDLRNACLKIAEDSLMSDYEVIGFRDRPMVLKRKEDELADQTEINANKGKTDLLQVFEAVDNYLDNEEIDHIFFISDFYDYSSGQRTLKPNGTQDDTREIKIRKEKIYRYIEEWCGGERNYSICFLTCESSKEASDGYMQLDAQKINSEVENTYIMEQKEDNYLEEKKACIAKAVEFCSGRKVRWESYGGIPDKEEYKDYYVYSEGGVSTANRPEQLYTVMEFRTGGNLYHIKGIPLSDIKLEDKTRRYYILRYPVYKIELELDNKDMMKKTEKEGGYHISLHIKDEDDREIELPEKEFGGRASGGTARYFDEYHMITIDRAEGKDTNIEIMYHCGSSNESKIMEWRLNEPLPVIVMNHMTQFQNNLVLKNGMCKINLKQYFTDFDDLKVTSMNPVNLDSCVIQDGYLIVINNNTKSDEESGFTLKAEYKNGDDEKEKKFEYKFRVH